MVCAWLIVSIFEECSLVEVMGRVWTMRGVVSGGPGLTLASASSAWSGCTTIANVYDPLADIQNNGEPIEGLGKGGTNQAVHMPLYLWERTEVGDLYSEQPSEGRWEAINYSSFCAIEPALNCRAAPIGSFLGNMTSGVSRFSYGVGLCRATIKVRGQSLIRRRTWLAM